MLWSYGIPLCSCSTVPLFLLYYNCCLAISVAYLCCCCTISMLLLYCTSALALLYLCSCSCSTVPLLLLSYTSALVLALLYLCSCSPIPLLLLYYNCALLSIPPTCLLYAPQPCISISSTYFFLFFYSFFSNSFLVCVLSWLLHGRRPCSPLSLCGCRRSDCSS